MNQVAICASGGRRRWLEFSLRLSLELRQQINGKGGEGAMKNEWYYQTPRLMDCDLDI
jgi:hypothetical protein